MAANQRRSLSVGAEIYRLQGYILGEFGARLSMDTLRQVSPDADLRLAALLNFDVLVLGGSVAAGAYGRNALPTSARSRMSALLGRASTPDVWVAKDNTFDLGALGAWYGAPEHDRAWVSKFADKASLRGESFVTIVLDVGATKTHVLSIALKQGGIWPLQILHRTNYQTPRSAPTEFYRRLGEEVAEHLRHANSVAVVPMIFMGHPGILNPENSTIISGTARNLGSINGEFSEINPGQKLIESLEELGFFSFAVSVCNDGEAQLAASIMTAEADRSKSWIAGQLAVYAGLGTGMGFAACRVGGGERHGEPRWLEMLDCPAVGALHVEKGWLAATLASGWAGCLDISLVLEECSCWGDLLSGHFLSVCMKAANEFNQQALFESVEPSTLSDLMCSTD